MQQMCDIRGFKYIQHFMYGMQGLHVTHVFHVLIIPSVSSVRGVMCVQGVPSGKCVVEKRRYMVRLNQLQHSAYRYQCR